MRQAKKKPSKETATLRKRPSKQSIPTSHLAFIATLMSARRDSASVRAALVKAWEKMELSQHPVVKSIGSNPTPDVPELSLLMMYVWLGFYPPPDILLAVFSQWSKYMSAAGKLSLDEAMLGKSVQRAGNY